MPGDGAEEYPHHLEIKCLMLAIPVDVVFPEGEWTWLYGDNSTYEDSASFTLALDEFTAFARTGSEVEATLLGR